MHEEEEESSRDCLKFGISKLHVNQPHVKRCFAFCQIDEEQFASSDGEYTYLWTRKRLEKRLDLPALALTYIKQNNHLIAYVRGSTQLRFVWLRHPYAISVQSLAFSSRVLAWLYYFEQDEVLVSVGHGVSFTSLAFPKSCEKGVGASLITLDRISEFQTDQIFTFVNRPLFVESARLVALYVQSDVYVYSAGGHFMVHVRDVSSTVIACMSFDEGKRRLVVGDTNGGIFFVDYRNGGSSRRATIQVAVHTLWWGIWERRFVVSITTDRMLYLRYTTATEECEISKILLDYNPFVVISVGDRILAFSLMGIEIFQVSVFLKRFRVLGVCSTMLRRLGPCQVMAFHQNSTIFILDQRPRVGIVAEVSAETVANGIMNCIPVDGTLFLVFLRGDVRMLAMSQCEVAAGMVVAVNSKSGNTIHIPIDVNASDLMIAVVQTELEKRMFGLAKSGHLYVFSVIQKKLITVENCKELANAVLVNQCSGKLLVSTESHLFVIDALSCRITKRVETDMITAMYEWHKHGLICGTLFGGVEIRDVDTLEIKYSSSSHHAFHLGRVVSLDVLQAREMVLSTSNGNDVHIWTKALRPVSTFEIPFDVSAACFLDNGSVILSSFGVLFTIDPLHCIGEALVVAEPPPPLRIPLYQASSASLNRSSAKASREQTPRSARSARANRVNASRSAKPKPVKPVQPAIQIKTVESAPEEDLWEDLVVDCPPFTKPLFYAHVSVEDSPSPPQLRDHIHGLLLKRTESSEILNRLDLPPDLRPSYGTPRVIEGVDILQRLTSTPRPAPPFGEISSCFTPRPPRKKIRKEEEDAAPVTSLLYPQKAESESDSTYVRLNTPSQQRKDLSSEETREEIEKPKPKLKRLTPTPTDLRRIQPFEPALGRRITAKLPDGMRSPVPSPRNVVIPVEECAEPEDIPDEHEEEANEPYLPPPAPEPVDTGPLMDMNKAMVNFVDPTIDYGTIGDLTAEEIQRELEARSGNIVFRSAQKTRNRRGAKRGIQVTRVYRSARRP